MGTTPPEEPPVPWWRWLLYALLFSLPLLSCVLLCAWWKRRPTAFVTATQVVIVLMACAVTFWVGTDDIRMKWCACLLWAVLTIFDIWASVLLQKRPVSRTASTTMTALSIVAMMATIFLMTPLSEPIIWRTLKVIGNVFASLLMLVMLTYIVTVPTFVWVSRMQV